MNKTWPCGAKRLKSEPSGYIEWDEWVHRKLLTHECLRCPTCHLWHVWVNKPRLDREGTRA